MTIRSITQQDLDACAELYAAVFSAPPWRESWSREHAYQRLSHFYHSAGFEGRVYDAQGIKALVLGTSEPFGPSTLFYLREMCVHPQQQNRGIGKYLLTAFIKILKQSGIDEIYLFTERDIPAAHFYRSLGFRCDSTMQSFSLSFDQK